MLIREFLKKNKLLVRCVNSGRITGYKIATIISPKLNTALHYKAAFHRKWDPDNPLTVNDKILWLKFNTYWNNPLVKQCADKYRVRQYIEDIGCKEILNNLIAVYDDEEDIEWDSLPEKYALKLNVGCGANIIVTDSSKLDVEETKAQVKKWMHSKYYLLHSEMQYKGVKPCIIVEEYLQPKKGLLPEDYKFYCINGKAEYVMVCVGREQGGHPKFYFYDRNWNFVPFEEQNDPGIQKPKLIDKAFVYADILASPFPFVRTDLYLFDDRIVFGELTFTSAGGFDNDLTEDAQITMGKMINLEYASNNWRK